MSAFVASTFAASCVLGMTTTMEPQSQDPLLRDPPSCGEGWRRCEGSSSASFACFVHALEDWGKEKKEKKVDSWHME